MFSATRKKFVEGVESDYPDESLYYQPSMFPHRSEKDVSVPQHVPNLGEGGGLVQFKGGLMVAGLLGCFHERPPFPCGGSFIAFFLQKANILCIKIVLF